MNVFVLNEICFVRRWILHNSFVYYSNGNDMRWYRTLQHTLAHTGNGEKKIKWKERWERRKIKTENIWECNKRWLIIWNWIEFDFNTKENWLQFSVAATTSTRWNQETVTHWTHWSQISRKIVCHRRRQWWCDCIRDVSPFVCMCVCCVYVLSSRFDSQSLLQYKSR